MLAGVPGPVGADDHRPPTVLLRVAGFPQRPRVVRVDWVTREDGRCTRRERREELRFPHATAEGVGLQRGVVRFLTPRKPRNLRVFAWAALDPARQPVGPPEAIPVSLEPQKRNGRTVAWDGTFELAVVDQRYLLVRARWPDRDRCPGSQKAAWAFAIRGM